MMKREREREKKRSWDAIMELYIMEVKVAQEYERFLSLDAEKSSAVQM